MIRTLWVRVPALVASGWLVAAPLAATDVDHADLVGSWRLNDELSDDVKQKAREAAKARRAESSRAGSADGRQGRRFGGGWKRLRELRKRLKQMEKGARSMHILATADGYTVRNGNDRVTRIVPDGEERTREGGFGPIRTSAAWEDDALVVVDRSDGGAVVTRRYHRSIDAPRLIVDVSIAGRGMPFDYRSVYDRVEPD